MEKRARRWWAMAVWAGLGLLVVVVVVASASTSAPQQANRFYKEQLSEATAFGAYPDIAVGENGLVAAVWPQGPGPRSGKHYGPVKLSWISDSAEDWERMTVDTGPANDVAVALMGTTAHVAWIQHDILPKEVYYKSCDLAQASPSCTSRELVAEGGETGTPSKVSQVNLALSQDGAVYVVWAEGDNRGIFYNIKPAGESWQGKGSIDASANTDSDFPVIAVNHFDGEDYAHVAWAQRIADLPPYYIARYCRWDGAQWDSHCPYLLGGGQVGEQSYSARNLSIAADGYGNVYVVWDLLVDSVYKREYAIGQIHSDDNGSFGSWPVRPRTYPGGDDLGTSGAVIFKSGEEATIPEPETGEYAHFLRPHISLAASGTLTVPVPVLTWHAQVFPKAEPELFQLSTQVAHKVFWTYATQPGSDAFGDPFWATDGVITTTDYITLSTNFCGELEMRVNSATPRLAIAGDLNDAINGGLAGQGHLHAVYHEEIGEGVWGVFYTSNVTVDCLKVYLPLMLQVYDSGGERQ